MLRIWGRTNSINVQKVMWTVGELGLAHERIDAGGAFGRLDTEEYGRLNPNRRVPTIEDDDTVVWESNAIVRYLTARYGAGGLWPEDPAERARGDMWMDWITAELIPDMTPVFWGLIRTPAERRDQTAIDAAVKRLADKWRLLDGWLAGREYVAGDRLTMGDVPAGAACYRYHELPIERPTLPNVAAWYARLRERAPFREHVMIPLS
jgi:glutathione S-transferase